MLPLLRVVKPAHELLGEMLLARKRPAEARREFEAALARAPRRALSLLGLARSLARTGERELSRATYSELALMCEGSDQMCADQEIRRGSEAP